MYLEPTIQRNKKRRSSPLRVIFLLILISAGIYVYIILQQEEIESPFVPTPTPTRSAFSYTAAAGELYLQGRLTETIASYEQAIALMQEVVELEGNPRIYYTPSAKRLMRKAEEKRHKQQMRDALDEEETSDDLMLERAAEQAESPYIEPTI